MIKLSLLSEPWLWIIILILISILVGPFIILYLILLLPDFLKIVLTFSILVMWGVVGGYKDWVIDKKKRKIKCFEV